MMNFQLFDTLLEAVFVLNKNKEILYCNEVAATLAGSTPRKIVRAKNQIDGIFTFETKEDFFKLDEITESTPYRELRFKNQAGQNGIVQVTLQKLEGTDSEDQWLVYFRDVTLEEQLQNKYRAQLEQKEGVILELKKAQNELENYSKNLEELVSQRTLEITELNRTMMALLNSLKQGFFIFDESGDCLPVFSKACESILETKPAGKKIWDVLKLPAEKIAGLQRWILTVFGEMLPFEDLAPLGPATYPHSLEKSISIEYFPLHDEHNKIKGIVVMASDISDLIQAQHEAENEKARVRLILQIVQNKKHLRTFVKEIESWFTLLGEQLVLSAESINLEEIKRALHTIKGNAGLYSMKDLVEVTHACEEKVSDHSLEIWKPFLTAALPKMRQHFQSFLNQAHEILGPQSEQRENKIEVSEQDLKNLCDVLSFWSKGRHLSQKLSEKYLQQHLHNLFEPFNQVAQQTAVQLGKQVQPLKIWGPDIALGNLDLSPLFSALIHCFRNSIDHGLETPEVRQNLGKLPEGRIQITTGTLLKENKDYLFFSIQDDGAGINPQKIREKLASRGISTDNESDEAVIQHIFDPSFSTKTEITEISGRGVGLDAVKAAVHDLQGEIHVKSVMGQGTCFEFYIPLLPSTVAPAELPSTKVA